MTVRAMFRRFDAETWDARRTLFRTAAPSRDAAE
jgi:hypothetical protein